MLQSLVLRAFSPLVLGGLLWANAAAAQESTLCRNARAQYPSGYCTPEGNYRLKTGNNVFTVWTAAGRFDNVKINIGHASSGLSTEGPIDDEPSEDDISRAVDDAIQRRR